MASQGNGNERRESDFLGTVSIPQERLYGPQTARTLEYLPATGNIGFLRPVIYSLAEVKRAAAQAAAEFGVIEPEVSGAIVQASHELVQGSFDRDFVFGWLQIGSGTSTNMTVNEVIANRSNQLLGSGLGARWPVHPNDHVNVGQSSNDVFPTAIQLSVLRMSTSRLIPAIERLSASFHTKSQELDAVVKAGRTHLMDALPVTLGQEFSGYARQVDLGLRRITAAMDDLRELPLGGTSVGTGLNGNSAITTSIIDRLAKDSVFGELREAKNHFEAQGAQDALVTFHGALRGLAVSLTKISEDLRLMASGPRAGLREIRIPQQPPMSSAMPKKGAPVVLELVLQASALVMGNDTTVSIAGAGGRFELNTCMPLMAKAVLESVDSLARSIDVLDERCISGLEADVERCKEFAQSSLALAAALVHPLGYDLAASIADQAEREGTSIYEAACAEGSMTSVELKRLLDVEGLALRRNEGGKNGPR